jgi:hypothetical protein
MRSVFSFYCVWGEVLDSVDSKCESWSIIPLDNDGHPHS